jgi:hypothetical protein
MKISEQRIREIVREEIAALASELLGLLPLAGC